MKPFHCLARKEYPLAPYFWSVLAVEAIVDPRHKAADCEQTDAHVVQLAEELGHMLAGEVIVRDNFYGEANE